MTIIFELLQCVQSANMDSTATETVIVVTTQCSTKQDVSSTDRVLLDVPVDGLDQLAKLVSSVRRSKVGQKFRFMKNISITCLIAYESNAE